MNTSLESARSWRKYANDHLCDGEIDTKTVELIVKHSRVEALKEALSRIDKFCMPENPTQERSWYHIDIINELIEEIEEQM